MNKNKKLSAKKIIISIIILLIIVVNVYIGKDFVLALKNDDIIDNEEPPTFIIEEEKKINIIDVDSKTRTFAVMIDNIRAAWPHAGLDDAHLVYEIIAEGGQTRLLALFKDKYTELIGPVRSARHYFLDYGLEHGAMFVHYGMSPQAGRDISLLNVNNLNGMGNSNAFWRATDVVAPHNVFTSISKLSDSAIKLGYEIETEVSNLLNYSIEEINLEDEENKEKADFVRINYSMSHYTSYRYDPDTKTYLRYMLGIAHTDKVTQEQYAVKNIIIISVGNHADPFNPEKGRQTLNNIGDGTGYYITNGYAIPIIWQKDSRTGQTIYKKINGETISVNDGNTYIQIKPLNQSIIFE